MHTVDYLLLAALTSAVVALGIEWIAKPRLEARKERILSATRARATFDSRLLQIEVICAMWKDLPPIPAPRASLGERQRLQGELERAIALIDAATRDMLDEIGSFALTYVGLRLPGGFGPIPNLIVRYVTLARGLAISDRTNNEKFRLLYEMTSPLRLYLFATILHPVKRVRAMIRTPDIGHVAGR
jgi:hypothetical protein